MAFNANIRIKDLPDDTNHLLNMIACKRGITKWEVVRDALTEYVGRYKGEVAA
jgi:predicted transcriptional regulator